MPSLASCCLSCRSSTVTTCLHLPHPLKQPIPCYRSSQRTVFFNLLSDELGALRSALYYDSRLYDHLAPRFTSLKRHTKLDEAHSKRRDLSSSPGRPLRLVPSTSTSILLKAHSHPRVAHICRSHMQRSLETGAHSTVAPISPILALMHSNKSSHPFMIHPEARYRY